MKIAFTLLFLLVTASAFAQYGSAIGGEAHMLQVPDHPQHADIQPMAREQLLVGGTGQTYATGERPLWEFGSPFPPAPPLGDVARAYRQEKLTARKATIVFEKQGSR